MMAKIKPNSKFLHLYAVVRVDLPLSADNPQNSISVVKGFESLKYAEEDAARLNKLNQDKGCIYFSQTTRLVN